MKNIFVEQMKLIETMLLYMNEFGIVCVSESLLANELGISIDNVRLQLQELNKKYFVIEKIKYDIFIIHHENINI